MKKRYLMLVLALLVIATLGLIYQTKNEANFSYAGTLDSTTTLISTRVNAQVLERPVLEGQWVKKDQLIAVMDDRSFQIAAKQLDANFKRFSELYRKGAATKANLEEITRQKESNDLDISWCKIYAPMDGLVVTVYKGAGEYLTAGTAVCCMTNPRDDLYAYFYVPHDFVCRLKVGDAVVGTLPEMPERKFKGKITKINEEPEFTPKNVQTRKERTRLVYGVKVAFENADLTLKRGMTIETNFEQNSN